MVGRQHRMPRFLGVVAFLLLLLKETSCHGSSVTADAGAPRNDVNLLNHNNNNLPNDDAAEPPPSSWTTAQHGQRQMDWVRATPGGFVHDAFDIRQATDGTGRYGVFASRDVAAKEILLVIPRTCLIDSEEDEDGDICETVANLAREMKLNSNNGTTSRYEPYVTYLHSQAAGQLPTMWSEAGQDALLQLLGQDDDDDEGYPLLPPHNAIEAGHDCEYDETDEIHVKANMLVTQRSWDNILIPVWDMVSHRNGRWTNVDEWYSVHDEDYDVTVYATRAIAAGEELFMSYDHCRDCAGRAASHYGTPEILRDYGFVEAYPQKFAFWEQHVVVGVDQSDHDKSELQLTWHSPRPTAPARAFFQAQVDRLQGFAAPPGVPEHEWAVIVGYQQALLTVLQLVIDTVAADGGDDATITTTTTEESNPDSKETDEDDDDDEEDFLAFVQSLIDDQVEWVRSHAGFVSGHVDFAPLKDPQLSSSSSWGLFATQDLAAGELLVALPDDVILGDSETYDGESLPCATAWALAEEWQALFENTNDADGNTDHGPYVYYLQQVVEHQIGHYLIPSMFTATGREWVHQLLGSYGGQPILPPEEVDGWIDDDWNSVCGGGGDGRRRSEQETLGQQWAAALTVQRHWGGRLLPLVDLIRHCRQPNAVLVVQDDDDSVELRTLEPIAAGQEIWVHYGSWDEYHPHAQRGAPWVFRDAGALQLYPQKWTFDGGDGHYEAHFELGQVQDNNNNNKDSSDDDDLVVTWDEEFGRPHDRTLILFEEQVERLHALWEDELQHRPADMPLREWTLIRDYHHALSRAMTRAVETAHQGDSCSHTDDSTCGTSSTASRRRYDALDTPYGLQDYDGETCDPTVSLDLSEFTTLEHVQSPYQHISYLVDPSNNNMCFDLDKIYQICSSYRPQYHEYVVHYTARFLPEIKRIIWIGGGDSMLLHEVLKYPNIELVIGLELDQRVTRGAFKYFGSQPHWDNDKVQWWYGDAAKSLLMLPQEYFGTFDMVLVDLSETVMSNTVTKGLDIMGALSLLLKEDGIFVKNEMYFEGLSQLFQHTLQLHYYGVPLICSQCLILASNKVNFMNVSLTDHKVKALMPTVQEIDYDFQVVRDYMHNTSAKMQCAESDDDTDESSEERNHGIVMILEAENALAELESVETVESAIARALEPHDMAVLSTKSSSVPGVGNVVVAVLQKGYVVARTMPAKKYCAFDIHLWGSFGSLEGVKESLLAAVGGSSQSSSSFRIVAGGMSGVEEPKKNLGPPKTSVGCESSVEESTEASSRLAGEPAVVVVEETLSALSPTANATVVVACGPQGTSCASLDVAAQHASVGTVVPLWTCASVEGLSEYEEDHLKRMMSCESDVLAILNGQTVGIVILDPSAPFAMAQIVRKIPSRVHNRRKFFSDNLMAVAPLLDTTETWRRVFVDHFRLFYNREPAFMAKVLYHGTDSTLEVATFASDNELFITQVRKATTQIASRLGMEADIRNIGGVKFTMQHDFEPTHFFLPKDYEYKEGYAQWLSQQPEGHQTIFQMEILSGPLNKKILNDMMATTLLQVGIHEPPVAFAELGNGSLLVAMWSGGMSIGGHAILLWDGQSHLTLNIFTFQKSADFATAFVAKFSGRTAPALKIMLRDEMPRGHGRVVNFHQDLQPRRDPYWTK